MMTSISGPTHRRDDEFDLIMYVECGNLGLRRRASSERKNVVMMMFSDESLVKL